MPSFGPFELKPQRRRLLRDGKEFAIGARAFDVLLALSETRDRVVTQAEFLDLVWPSLVIADGHVRPDSARTGP